MINSKYGIEVPCVAVQDNAKVWAIFSRDIVTVPAPLARTRRAKI
jgi:hypothetical protein